MHNRLAPRLVLGLAVLAPACGGDDVEHPPAGGDTIPPTIESVSPAADANGVDLRSVIQVTFSEPVNPATVATASFYLRQVGTPTLIPLAYSYAGRTATATPDQPFDSLTAYRATLTRAVRDSAGNPLAADTTWQFRTRGGPIEPPAPQALRTRS
jgi:hypothetical protein